MEDRNSLSRRHVIASAGGRCGTGLLAQIAPQAAAPGSAAKHVASANRGAHEYGPTMGDVARYMFRKRRTRRAKGEGPAVSFLVHGCRSRAAELRSTRAGCGEYSVP